MPGAAPSDGPVIVAENASKLFLDGAVTAFRQLNLTVSDRETMCIVGPSGCGKTTLLRCIAGLTEISGGKLLVDGKPVDGSARRRRHGVPAFRPAAVEDGLRQRRVRARHRRRASRDDPPARRALSRTGRARRLREALSLSTLRRHAAARRPRARARHQPVGAADGRAVRLARRADARNPAGGIAAASWSGRTSARPWCSSPIRSTRRSCSATASR